MSRHHWFLPDMPDILGLLRRQVALTVEAMDAFAAWAAAGGDAQAAATVRALEHEADTAKHELREALRSAFVTPLDPEDLFALSRGIDWILNHAEDAIGVSEAMSCPPDGATAAMAALLAECVRHIDEGVAQLQGRSGDATKPADAALKTQRRLEQSYHAAMGGSWGPTWARRSAARSSTAAARRWATRSSTSPSGLSTRCSRRTDRHGSKQRGNY